MYEKRREVGKNLNAQVTWWSFAEFSDEVIVGLKNMHHFLIASAALLMLACLIASFGANGYQVNE